MNRTELSLDVLKSFNLKTLTLLDTSKYCDEDTITNYLVEILPPNSTKWVTHFVKKNFSLILNSSNLGYVKASANSSLVDLPDGIYEFKQSYKPNILSVVHFYHLRTSALTLKYIEQLCAHLNNECKKDERTYVLETQHLVKIKQYIDAAEYTVSEKHDKETGIAFYNRAIELIQQLENECSGCR